MSLDPKIMQKKLEELAAAVAVSAGLKLETPEQAFYAAHKFRSLRTEMTAIIKALEGLAIEQPKLKL